MCEKYNAKRVVLDETDILQYFDCDYHRYVQGACCHNSKIYSLEGFTNSISNPPAIRVIDTELKKEILFKKVEDLGYNIEPEMIDFENDIPVSSILYVGMSKTKYLKSSGRSRYTKMLADDMKVFYSE